MWLRGLNRHRASILVGILGHQAPNELPTAFTLDDLMVGEGGVQVDYRNAKGKAYPRTLSFQRGRKNYLYKVWLTASRYVGLTMTEVLVRSSVDCD
jgi:hypothetical protein